MAAPKSAAQFRMTERDWVCDDPKCANVNFARRQNCNLCGKERPEEQRNSGDHKRKLGHEIGKAAAEKSKGLFSADDWQCGRCGNVNWARRQQCNMCNAPKFGENEERTGLGGGYNERDQVEYIERDESDSEYDDFGRKKKKFRDAPTSANSERKKEADSSSSLSKKEEEEAKKNSGEEDNEKKDDDEDDDRAADAEDEEEDEEEDDDDDVSKYKLDSDDDEEDEAKA